MRWFAAAAAPCSAPRTEEWSDGRVPFVAAVATVVPGALVVVARREALTGGAERPGTRHTTGDEVAALVNPPEPAGRW